MLSKQGYISCNIAEATPLALVLLKQYYSSYKVADSKCSGLKIIESMLLYQRIAKATPFYWNVTESKVILHNVGLAICPSMVLPNQTQRYSCGCYLV